VRRAKLAISLAFASLFAACYDWAVRSGATVENPRDDAGNDDAEADVPFLDSGEEVGPSDAALSCDALAGELDATMRRAQECTINSGDCTLSVKDECGCTHWLKVPDAAANTAYFTTRQQFLTAGCKPQCAAFCLPAGTGKNCIFTLGETVPHCSP
jgi:hypothetical protein